MEHKYIDNKKFLIFYREYKNQTSYEKEALSLIKLYFRDISNGLTLDGMLEDFNKLDFSNKLKIDKHQYGIMVDNVFNPSYKKPLYQIRIQKNINKKWKDIVTISNKHI